MLNDLLEKENILEDDIIVNRGEVPSVWYEDANGKQRRYFVDCYIKSQNRCIEATSTWTANWNIKLNNEFIGTIKVSTKKISFELNKFELTVHFVVGKDKENSMNLSIIENILK